MTDAAVRAAFDRRRGLFDMLASSTSSMPELMLKVSVYGGRWTKTDWLLFFGYLQYQDELPQESGPDGPRWRGREIMESLLDSVGKDPAVDAIVTNRDMARLFVAGTGWGVGPKGKLFAAPTLYVAAFCLTVLARTVAAYPEIWKMNFMWTRHRGGGRTHKLLELVGARLRRGDGYAGSDAARADFVNMFWNVRNSRSFVATRA